MEDTTASLGNQCQCQAASCWKSISWCSEGASCVLSCVLHTQTVTHQKLSHGLIKFVLFVNTLPFVAASHAWSPWLWLSFRVFNDVFVWFSSFRVNLTPLKAHSLLCGIPWPTWTTTTYGGPWMKWERRYGMSIAAESAQPVLMRGRGKGLGWDRQSCSAVSKPSAAKSSHTFWWAEHIWEWPPGKLFWALCCWGCLHTSLCSSGYGNVTVYACDWFLPLFLMIW